MKITNRDRILKKSIELFNTHGVVAITTNHIADALNISPGNLYFHFRNKEQIALVLYNSMTADLYALWELDRDNPRFQGPLELIEATMKVFWEYRFFHREMYHLRRKDAALSKAWKAHLKKSVKMLRLNYLAWVDAGVMKPIDNPEEMQMLTDLVLITSNAFLNFYESPEKPATTKAISQGLQGVSRLLEPYQVAH